MFSLIVLCFVFNHRRLNPFHLLQQFLFAYDAFLVQDVDQRLGLDDFGHEEFFKFDHLFLVKLISAAQWPHLMALASNSLPQLGHL